MLKLFLFFLFASAVVVTASDDAICSDFCSKCGERQSDLCAEVHKTCQCEVSSSAEKQTEAETENPAAENVHGESNAPILKATFAPSQENKQQINGAIMNVNFGNKGDGRYTAELQSDGSYKMKDKDNTAVWIAIGSASLLTIVFIIVLAL